jgi:flagellar hook-length control protein FliK
MELNPARLGKIRVRMSMESNELQLTLASQNTAVRDLLEASLPRLRDGFVDSGIQLTQTNIQQDLSGGQQRGANGASQQEGGGQQQAHREASTGNGASEGQNAETRSNHDGELDLFA